MSHWKASRTDAQRHVGVALKAVDDLLSYVKDSQGKPSKKERALFAAAVVFTYGIWENFVEQLALELTKQVADVISPEKVPDQIRKLLEKKTAWELTVSPGWRALWVKVVTGLAVGDGDEKFGLNTAKAGQVQHLLMHAGVSNPYQTIPDSIIPEHLGDTERTATESINCLVELRGAIVHTGTVPDSLRKSHVLAWRDFVEGAADKIDEACRAQCGELTANPPKIS